MIASPAVAQDATVSDQAAPEEDQAATPVPSPRPAPTQVQQDDEIVVTGSRIRRTESSSSSPLQIIDPELSQRQGRLSTSDMIQSSPIAQGSTQITSAISTNFVTNGGPGTQTVSLRGLGAERTLVMLNSRRAGPAGTRGAIASFDLNILPSSIVKSVEILKDGASSIYGSDAIAGVVNIITKTHTDGLELSGYANMPLKSGGESYNASAAWGKDFGRGHIMLAVDWYKQSELERKDRKYLDCPEDYIFRKDMKTRADLVDPRTGKYRCDGVIWGQVWTYGVGNMPDYLTLLQYSYPGDNLGNYIGGMPPAAAPGDLATPPGWFPVGLDGDPASNSVMNLYHPYERASSVIPRSDRITGYLDGSFEISDNVEAYAEGLFNRRRTYEDSLTQFYNFGYTGLYAPGDPDDPFPGFTNPEGGNSYVSPTGIIDVHRKYTVDYYRGILGLRGDVGKTWHWDVYGHHSLSNGKYKLQQILNDVIYQQTLRAYGYGCAGLFTPISNRECLQMNWVDPRVMAGDLSDEERNYLFDTETGRTKYKQSFVEASATGNVFDLPAGAVGVAVGAVIRRDSIDDQPGHITQAANPDYDPTDPTSPQFVDNAFANGFSSGHTYGHTVTKEAFAEVNIPVFKDATFAKSFELSGAGRVTSVKAVRGSDGFTSNNKGNFTYKVMANWQVNDWVRFRATMGTSFRAPALFEQFLAGQASGARQSSIDPCVSWQNRFDNGEISQRVATNCAADGISPTHSGAGIQATVFTSGGIGELKPEKSKAKTASIILTPRFAGLPNTRMSLVLDYFDITVRGEIDRLTARDIVYGCYESDNFPNDPRCSLFERGQDGDPENIKNVFSRFINIDEQRNTGLDMTFRLDQQLGFGKLSVVAQGTRQFKDTVSRLGEFDVLNGDIGDPKFNADINTSLDLGSTTLFWGVNYIGKSSSVADYNELNGDLCSTNPNTISQFDGDVCVKPKAGSAFYHNFSVTQEFAKRFEVTLGMSNVFNRKPPKVSGVSTIGTAPALASQYDWLGRRMFINAKARF
nr:TonB-dependent receptor [uncultured Sphingomonas sp.]